MAKYANRCPASTDIDLYKGCPLGCVYCIAQHYHKHAPKSRPVRNVATILAGIDASIEADGKVAPCYLSPWTDAYQPLEREARLSRGVLAGLARRGLSFFVITRSLLVERDLDLFVDRDAFVAISLNTLDDGVTRRLEPGAPGAGDRRALLRRMVSWPGLRTVVKVDPIIPGVTDGASLDRLLSWLAELKPHAVTLETLRISTSMLQRLEPALTRGERRRLQALYLPARGDAPRHPILSYRVEIFRRAAQTLGAAGVRACFCRATLPDPITPYDCRGGL
jgi:DNA repair photolyase